ncbi:MAG: hypothetical protein V4572_09790 [Bacteroidota bacterium]
MKRKTVLVILIFIPFITFSQTFTRKIFDYKNLEKDYPKCTDNILKELNNSVQFLEQNNSEKAVELAKKVFEENKGCPEIYQNYGYCLFRNGQLIEGVNIIENGIEIFGSVPDLIKKKSEMSLELFEIGIGQRNIDGNTIYLSQDKRLKYDEQQFKDENLKSALLDLEYLTTTYENRNEELYIVAKIKQMNSDFDKSNEIFEKLSKIDEYRENSIFNIADNYIKTKKYDEAEKHLLNLIEINPKEGQLYNKLASLYELKGDKIKQNEFNQKAFFYRNIPYFSDLEYNDKNYNLILFFGSEKNNYKDKINKLKLIQKTENENYVIDICLVILKLHANHGNELEDDATKILIQIGKNSLEKTHKLIKTNISTCTITYLSEIMSTIKDETSWEILTEYLSMLPNMPSTLIPPNIPEQIIKFNEERGTKEILKVVKPLLDQEQKSNVNNPMAELSSFNDYIYYSALENVNNKTVFKIAKELEFSEKEMKKLKEKIKK